MYFLDVDLTYNCPSMISADYIYHEHCDKLMGTRSVIAARPHSQCVICVLVYEDDDIAVATAGQHVQHMAAHMIVNRPVYSNQERVVI